MLPRLTVFVRVLDNFPNNTKGRKHKFDHSNRAKTKLLTPKHQVLSPNNTTKLTLFSQFSYHV